VKTRVLPHDLKAGLKWIKPAYSRASILPVLHNVLVEATNQGVRLTATDLQLSASAFIGGRTEKVGATTLPIKALDILAKNLPDEPLGFDVKKNAHVTLRQGSRTIQLRAIDANEFPVIWPAKGKTYNALDDLVDGCKFIEHALASNDNRPGLAYAEVKKGKLWAADGFRLAIAPGFNGEASLHRSLVNFLARTKEEPTKLTLDDNLVTVWFGDNWVTATQHDGRFPDWEQVICKPESCIALDFQEFLAKISLVFSLKPVADLVRFQPKKGRLYMEFNTTDEDLSYKDWIQASCNGQREVFALNAKYLLEAVVARKPFLKDGWFKIKVQTPSTGMMLVDQHTDFVEMLMPMHISR